MNAQQAKELAKKKNLELFELGAGSIKQKIEEAAKKGGYYINISSLRGDVKLHLENLGYKVKYEPGDPRDQRESSYFIISWE
jgi:hypothetical protein